MRILLVIFILCIASSSFSQSGNYFVLIFNGKPPVETSLGYEYQLEDILAADSVEHTAEYWEIKEFICSSVCFVDWEHHTKGKHLSEQLKKYIKNCSTHDKKKLYFNRIILEEPTGRKFVIDEFIAIIRM